MKTAIFAAMPVAAILLTASAQAQNTFWSAGAGDWSTATNWSTGDVPDTSAEIAFFSGVGNAINMDANFTAGAIRANFAASDGTNTLSGPGVLTVDPAANNGLIGNLAGNAGGIMRLNGNMVINNTGGNALTFVRNDNSGGNLTEFGTGSTLTLNTLLLTHPGIAGSTIAFNGTLASSSADLRIGGDNVSFNAGHDSSAFGRDLVYQSVGGGVPKLAVNGGTVLASGRKLQVNASGELELNAANAWNGADISVGGANDLLLDVNANQMNMGTITLGTGTLTLDLLGGGVTNLFFADSSGAAWDGGTVSIFGFQEDVIKFGSDSSGLMPTQLAAIDGGIYSLTSSGFLTAVPEPSALGLLLFGAMGLAVRRKRA